MKYEKTQKTNPHRISVNQHIFPVRSIDRFRFGNVVDLLDLKRGITRKAAPNDSIFSCRRVWDHASETGFMKHTEDLYQDLAEKLIAGKSINLEIRNTVVTKFYSLWCSRFYVHKYNNYEDVSLAVEGDIFTKNKEEKIESMNMSFVRSDGMMPARFIAGGQAQIRCMHYEQLYKKVKWGLVQAQNKEFMVPDNFLKVMVVPLSPKLAFIGGCRDGIALDEDVIKVNSAARNCAESFILCRDLTKCE